MGFCMISKHSIKNIRANARKVFTLPWMYLFAFISATCEGNWHVAYYQGLSDKKEWDK